MLAKFLLAASACLPLTCLAGDPELKLPAFEHLQAVATESVNVTLGAGPLALARLALDSGTDDRDTAELREILQGLKSVNVRSFQFARDHMYSAADLQGLHAQLADSGWSALAQVRQHHDSDQDVDIFVSTDHEKINGITLLVSAPRSFTVVNVVGSIDPAKLAKLQGKLGLPSLAM